MDNEIESPPNKADKVFLIITKTFVVLSTVFFIIGVSYSFGIDAGYGVSTAVTSTETATFLGFFMFFGVIVDVIVAMFSGLIEEFKVTPIHI